MTARDDMMIVAEHAVKKAKAGGVVVRPAQVNSWDSSTGEAIVTIDGDSSTAAAQVITGFPLRAGDRVVTMFVPPHGLLVVGHANGIPIIANEDDTGFLTALAVDPSWTNVKTLTLGSQPIAHGYRLVARSDYCFHSGTAGGFDAEVEIGISVDGGTTYTTNVMQTSATSTRYMTGSISVSAVGGSAQNRPRIRLRAHLLASLVGTYDLRNVFTTWTITPQGED